MSCSQTFQSARANERGEKGSGESRQVFMTTARMWAAPISSGILPNFTPWEPVIMASMYASRLKK